MADQVIGITIKGIGDFSDVVNNVNNVQKALTKLKLPDKLGNSLSKNISDFHSEYEKYQKKISEGIKTQGDYNQVEKSLNRLKSLYQEIGQDVTKLSKLDMDSLLNLDLGEFKQLRNEISNIEKEINKVQVGKINSKTIESPMEALRKSLKGKKFSEKETGLLDQLIGNVKSGKIQEAKAVLNELDSAVKKITPPKNAEGNFIEKVVGKLNPGNAKAATGAIEQLKQILSSTDEEVSPLVQVLDQLQKELLETKNSASGEILGNANKFNETQKGVEKVTDSLKRMHQEEFGFNRQVQDIDRQIQSYFGLAQMIRKVGDIARDAFNTVKELDAAMTETAVVTNFDVGDMWNMLPTYTEQANQLGATIKDVYEAATLYYQQGLNTNQAMGLANETLKMARIGGLDAAEATNMMTAALRGFNMEINQASAQKVNDIYSQLAAVTASDTREIGTAMEKTASLASSAGMEIGTTSAFLAQMIETTREAPENLGTAMKTIIARFQEMKKDPTKLVDSEGVAMDVNKIDTALKTIGVQLTNTKGEFRDLDDVFLDISAKWDTLSQGQQRYIATTAAGSRQQSRFIAMMSNYDRTMELVNEANNSAGASQKQFEKTMDSMSSKLNQLKNAWDQFTMGLMNNQILKAGVTGLTSFFTIINKIIDVISKISPAPIEGITKSILTLGATLSGLNFAKNFASGSVAAGVGWWKNEGTFTKNFQKGFGFPKKRDFGADANALLQRKIVGHLSDDAATAHTISMPVDVNTYLQHIDTLDLDEEVATRIKAALEDEEVIDKRVKINTILDDAYKKNEIDSKQYDRAKIADNGTVKGIKDLTQKTGVFTTNLTQMGVALQEVGAKMGPFGGILSTIGSIMTSVGTTLGALSASFIENFATIKADALAKQLNVAATQQLTDAEMVQAGTNLTLGNTFKVLAASIWSTMGPLLAIVAVIGAVVIAYKVLDAAIVTNKEKLENATEAANTASDAYSSAKQGMSELTDSLDTIQSNEDAFKGLVAGTTAFNEKLIESNQAISELLEKYPDLNNPKFLSTDKNGLMHISQDGIDYVKKEQARIVGNAAAFNSLQSAQLKAEEDRQKAEKIRKDSLLKSAKELSKGQNLNDSYAYKRSNEIATNVTPKVSEADERRAKLLEQEADNAERMARVQALSNSLVDVEADRRDKIAGIWEGTYDTALKQAEVQAKSADLNEKYQAYADFYGYNYDASTKKMTDRDNQEVSVDKGVIEDAFPEITVLTKFNADGPSLDSMIDSIDQNFGQKLEQTVGESFENSGSLLSDILNSNIEVDPDALQNIIGDPQKLMDAVGVLTNEQVGALMRVSAEEVAKAPDDKYRKDLGDWVKNRAQALLDTQQQTYEDLGAMLATSKFDASQLDSSQNKQAIDSIATEYLDKMSSEQINTLATIGKKLDESAGPDAMQTFLDQASDIYIGQDKDLTDKFNGIIEGISWESPASRLSAYTQLINSNDETLQRMGQTMQKTASESNLLGDTFDEFLGSDWTEMQENADDFKNSLGEIDGAGILKASEQSSSLKALLDSGKVSASGLAVALNGIESGSFFSLNDSMLKLLSSMNRLKDVALEAHNIIENFDAGIDTGEGEEFVKENAKAVQEYMTNNEWGNEQLQNYIKLAAGEERWNEALKAHKGNLKEVTKDLDQYVTKFSEGFVSAYDDIVKGKGINGKSLTSNIDQAIKDGKISKNLGDEFKRVKAEWDDNGFLQWNFEDLDLTTDELTTFFKEAYGVSEEYAKLFMQNMKNYSETEAAELAANDLKRATSTDDFKNEHLNANGELVLSNNEIEMIESAPGGEEALINLANAAGTSVEALKAHALQVTKDGKAVTEYDKLFGEYQKKVFKDSPFYKQKQFLDENNRLDVSKVQTDAKQRNMNDEQAIQMAFRAYQEAQKDNKTTSYNGQELESGIKSIEDFKERINSITESGQWVTVGQTIGEQIVNAMGTINWSELINGAKEENQPTSQEKPELFGPGWRFGANNINDSGLDTVYNKTVSEKRDASGEDIAAAISAHLAEHKQEMANLNTNQQRDAINSIVNKMNEWKMKPEDMTKAINDGLGTHFKEGDLSGKAGKVTLDQSALQQQLASIDFTINATAKITSIQTNASGQNNPNSVFHRVGTMARGSRGGYTIPGRPTLTGEEGEELVWEPKRNEAYMVGSNGPQFANISKDAVVWNASQTKRIKKNSGSVGRFGTGARGITPFGTMAQAQGTDGGAGGGGGGGRTIPGSFEVNVTGIVTSVKAEQEYRIPVTGDLKLDSGKDGGIAGKIKGLLGKGKENSYTIPVTGQIKTVKPGEGLKATVNVTGNVTNIKNTKTLKGIKATATVSKVVKSGKVSGEPVTVKAKASVSAETDKASKSIEKVSKAAGKSQKMTVDANNAPALAKVRQVINTIRNANPTLKYSVSGPSSISVPIYASFRGSWEKTVKINKGGSGSGAKGVNNNISTSSVPSIGSAAGGRYGRLGPNGKGGPTLTGEKGFEIAWIPSESRSMILGANGPQMIDLPSDAVVWTHEQSKKILAQKAIPAGSHSGIRKPTTTTQQTQTKNPSDGGKKETKGKKGGGKKDKTTKQTEKNTKEASKIIEKAGKISVWWENQTRKVDAIQRKVDKASKSFEKAIGTFGATFKSVGKSVNDYINKLNASIDINQTSYDKANKDLKKLNKGSATKSQKAAIKSAKAQVKAAKKTKKNKKDDKAAKKALDTAYLNAGYESISWDVTQKTTKKDKKGKKKTTSKKVTKEGYVDLSKYIKYDSATGAYVVDPNAISKVAKKNKSKAKAISEAANKKIDEAQGRKNTAEDNIIKSREALEELGKKLYETFLSWEIELTKIWNITQKITDLENKTSRLKEYTSLREAQINSGMAKANKSFIGESSRLFNAQLKSMGQSINARAQQIDLQKNEIKDLLLGTSNQATLANVNQKLNANADAAAKKNVVNSKQNQVNAINQQIKSLKQERSQYEKDLANQRKAEEQVMIAQQKAMAAEKKGKGTSKLQIGFSSVSMGSQDALMGGISRTSQQINQLQSQLKTAEAELKTAQNAYSQVSKNVLDSSQLTLYQQQQKALQEDEAIRQKALSYMNTPVQNADGTVSISFDTDRFKNDQQNLGITSEDATKIQNYVKKIQEANDELNKEYTELTQSLSELYETLEDLRKQQADDAEELLSITEEENKKHLEELKDLSDSIIDAIKDLLNEVKERLTERRNREDNAKTEQDISKKQQRLAALQADTSGGNAVEIAQLQKEIADAQQSYERSLEDQLLDRLQKQADDAARQREIMIELQQALLESSEKNSNLAQVNEWLNTIDSYQKGNITDDQMEAVWEEIREKYYSNKDYNSVTAAQQKIIEADFESLKERLGTNATNQENTKTAIEGATGALGLLKQSIDTLIKTMGGEAPKTETEKLAEEEAKRKAAEEAKRKAEEEARAAAAQRAAAEEAARQRAEAEARAAAQRAQRAQEEEMRRQAEAQRLRDYQINYENVLAQVVNDKQLNADELLKVKNAANALGYGADTYLQHLANTSLSWKQVIEAAKGANYNKDRIAATFSSSAFIAGFDAVYGKDAYKKRNKSAKKYATGGLADYTGPAWLDGTPSKPELVLNSKDTKNFLALRDVLGNVMGTVNSRDESYNSVNEFNININVDRIANDYDVDRMVERVKKDIIKSANYRNVTQIRSFR